MKFVTIARRRCVSRRRQILVTFAAASIILAWFAYAKYGSWLLEILHAELPCFEGAEKLERVRYMLSAWDTLAREEHIDTWIDYGSLLGAYRYKDLIPWDQDGDIGYLHADVGRVKFNVIPKLKERYGIEMKHYNPVIMRYQGTSIDVFAMASYEELGIQPPPGVSGGTLTRATFRASAAMEAAYSDMDPAWLFPTQRCGFGNLTLSCPKDIKAVLSKRYPHTMWLPFGFPFKFQCYSRPWNLLRIIALAIF